MSEATEILWTARPWVVPSLILRTIAFIVAGLVIALLLAPLATDFTFIPLGIYFWTGVVIGLGWLISLGGLLLRRASFQYVLRPSSLEVKQGIARKKSLIVSPSGFSELEIDQGLVARMLNYGSLEVRSQGGQQLNLMLVRDPATVSSKIRSVMTIPTVRIAEDGQGSVALRNQS